MLKETKVETVTTVIYRSIDGEEFSTIGECLFHEWRLKATKIYTVHERGARSESTEVYSTRDLAEEHIRDNKNRFIINELYLDERVQLIKLEKLIRG